MQLALGVTLDPRAQVIHCAEAIKAGSRAEPRPIKRFASDRWMEKMRLDGRLENPQHHLLPPDM